MRILHTADWHIGRKLYGKERVAEFEAFFAWLHTTIVEQEVDVLLVAGDVFDSVYPSHQSQSMYIKFLGGLSSTPCTHVVITAGNHDSAGLIDMHQPLLDGHLLNIHVVGRPNVEREVVVVSAGNESAIVCAVPYLREEDIQLSAFGDSAEDRSAQLHAGVEQHYTDVLKLAKQRHLECDNSTAQIVMGHLFTAGKEREAHVELESGVVRDLYVGGTPYVQPGVFGKETDYVALGHLHVPQTVNKQKHIRYSGSPIPMSFSEAGKQKSVVLFDIQDGNVLNIHTLEVPVFHALKRVKGDSEDILAELKEIVETEPNLDMWIEVEYTGKGTDGNLRQRIDHLVDGTRIEVLSIRNMFMASSAIESTDDLEQLEELKPEDVFARRLADVEEPDASATRLQDMFSEVLHDVLSRQHE